MTDANRNGTSRDDAIRDDASSHGAGRDGAIDAFFEAMDAEDPGIVRSALADGFVYDSLSGEFEGAAGLGEYLSEVRSISDVAHETTRRVHDGDVSVVEGVAAGDKEGEAFEARFCNVFEFDGDGGEGAAAGDALIARVRVYLNRA